MWYYQLTPHDLYDHDLQDPPILANANGQQIAIAAGKGGIVIAVDAQSGKLLWKRSVGVHNGHDNDSLYAMKHEYSKLHLPETVIPGLLGGVIAPMATNGSTVFVPVVNSQVTYTSQTADQEAINGAELVALNTATGAVEWTHKFSEPAFGAATAVNDLVFTTTASGKLYAFAANTGDVVWETAAAGGHEHRRHGQRRHAACTGGAAGADGPDTRAGGVPARRQNIGIAARDVRSRAETGRPSRALRCVRRDLNPHTRLLRPMLLGVGFAGRSRS